MDIASLTRRRLLRTSGLLAAAALVAGIAGCRIHTEKGPNGEDKSVQVDTPFGGLHVNTNQTTAADLGLPAYPGAAIVPDKDNDKSADVHLGFGQWELRVLAVNYATPDSQDKVSAFYKKALSRYGDVIVCQDNQPVGRPPITAEGLTCDDSGKNGPQVNVGDGNYTYGSGSPHKGLELKAGSKRHQHIVGFEKPEDGKTRFALVEIELPAGLEGSSGKSD